MIITINKHLPKNKFLVAAGSGSDLIIWHTRMTEHRDMLTGRHYVHTSKPRLRGTSGFGRESCGCGE